VWNELHSLDQILAKTLNIISYEDLSGDRARGQYDPHLGPGRESTRPRRRSLGLVAERQIRDAIEARRVESRFEASIDLIPLGLTETQLDDRGTFEVRPHLAARLRHPLDEMAEESVAVLIGCVKARSEKHRLAEEGLSFERL
jgi:hypothetical protein